MRAHACALHTLTLTHPQTTRRSYIFGGNEGAQSLEMTTPVLTRSDGASGPVTMAFPMQRRLGADPSALPTPIERTVTRAALPAAIRAAARFSGVATDADAAAVERTLRSALLADGLVLMPGFELARYNDPSTPGPFRRNEVLIQLQDFTM
jgi:hypothetical protein